MGKFQDMLRRELALRRTIRERVVYHDEDPHWNDADALIESVVPPPAEKPLQLIVANPQGSRTKAEVEALIRSRFPDLASRLVILHPRTKKIVVDQFPSLVELVYHIGELRENRQIIAPTGSGKTHVLSALIMCLRALYPGDYPLEKLFFICTKDKAQMQTRRILLLYGVLTGTIVTTLDSIRSGGLGKAMITYRTIMVQNEPVLYPFWDPIGMPCHIIVDESQTLKNPSIQSMLIESYAAMGGSLSVWSATPYSRVCQMRTIACALGVDVRIGNSVEKLTHHNFNQWAYGVCHPKAPEAWSPANLKRAQEWLEPKTTRWTCCYPYSVRTHLVPCHFLTPEDQIRYNNAYNDYLTALEMAGKNADHGPMAILVALGKFQQVASEIRAKYTAKYAAALLKERKDINIVLGFCYKTALEIARQILITECGYADKELAIVCGGIGARAEEDTRKFQQDKKRLMLLTIQSGGAGLDLSHNPFNRNKRIFISDSIYNDIQMIQFAGRGQRVNSCSAAELNILYFVGTEEVRKIQALRRKAKSLAQIVTKPIIDDGGRGSMLDQIENLEQKRIEFDVPQNEEDEEVAASRALGSDVDIQIEVVE